MAPSKKAVLNVPELHIAIFAFLLHFIWELIQMPLFAGFGETHYYKVILHCTRATFGDVVISLAAFWSACVVVKSRFWFLRYGKPGLWTFLGVGMLITIVFEVLATGPLRRWEYGGAMPVLPILGVGFSPVAQWIVLPLLQLWFVRRQVLGGKLEAEGIRIA
ncbi:hypothetical protein [Marinobacter fonticola]|uniref:hypothetical protein n=1 Tax=Marinobacter fonticola TaxID=2603215 RepID=UPI0011E79498|nr:hypothetical protein [Marinobacter fonticola]